MKLVRLIDSALIVVSIALLPGITSGKTVTSNSNDMSRLHVVGWQLTSFK
ncbi:hypothetical protein I8752_25135 [Nostocaceae cyanobacterium CENA369]|uniref:Uncharacterized protein n=1 Tax=Dendronalium phyllosphericum CENA369 TaxID=1725256 RepID=A0A8J7IB84_9NOST|nr:hypothetical protein [Dendronalium phyllosphericum]MBH8576216.1 hypothetical protein [Dendronalium phyllosphericum CENA369]